MGAARLARRSGPRRRTGECDDTVSPVTHFCCVANTSLFSFLFFTPAFSLFVFLIRLMRLSELLVLFVSQARK